MPMWDVAIPDEDGSAYSILGSVEAETKQEALKKASEAFDEPEEDLVVTLSL